MCEGCKKRDAVIQAAMYYCEQVQTISQSSFEEIVDNMSKVHHTKLGELIGFRARYELARETHLAIKEAMKIWEI